MDLFTYELLRRVDISTDYVNTVPEVSQWLLDKIESDEFQSWDMKIDLEVTTSFRIYDIMLYRHNKVIEVWIDGNYCYDMDLSSWGLSTLVLQLFSNWRWVPGIYMEYNWDWSDPVLHWNWYKGNYREIENTLYEQFIDWLKEDKQYDKFMKLNHSWQEWKFNVWLLKNYDCIANAFYSTVN